MKLKQIKLAGFKSFVDPTKIPFQKALTGVVGPNGCGKSNVIDAVRWVLGESSAKHLRGGAMTDVIFSGSNARRPVSVASVELSFDNQSGRLAGQYASYQEVSVKRQVSRDGESNYFLNGQKCRRKDITDLFMGTGLGPRSYAIIEQGMISRLIESKPQDLRVFIEEAAGISRYKERRRDTENRIRHTRDNLDRLGDIRGELTTQLDKLSSQAKSALKYRELKKSERKQHAQLLVMRYTDCLNQAETISSKINEQETLKAKVSAEHGTLENELTKLQLQLQDLTQEEQTQVADFYNKSTEIARLEQQITHQQQIDQKSKIQLAQYREQHTKFSNQVASFSAEHQNTERQLSSINSELEQQKQKVDQQQQAVELQQQTLTQTQSQFSELKTKQSSQQNEHQLISSKLEHTQQQLTQLVMQHDGINQQIATIGLPQDDGLDSELLLLVEKSRKAERELENCDSNYQQLKLEIEQQQQLIQATQKAYTANQSRLEFIEQWFAEHSPSKAQQVWQVVTAKPNWEQGLEVLLGELLSAEVISADNIGGIGFIEQKYHSKHSLLSQAQVNLLPWLSQVICVDNLQQAQAQVDKLKPEQLYVTKDGYLVGVGFVLKKSANSQSQLSFTVEKERLATQIKQAEDKITSITNQLTKMFAQRSQLEDNINQIKTRVNDFAISRASLMSKQTAIAEQNQKVTQQLALWQQQLVQLDIQKSELEATKAKTEQTLLGFESNKQDYNDELSTLELQCQQLQQQLQDSKYQLQQDKTRCEQLTLQQQQVMTQHALLTQQIQQTQQRVDEISQDIAALNKAESVAEEASTSIASVDDTLAALLNRQKVQQKFLDNNRQQQVDLQKKIDGLISEQKQYIETIEVLTRTISELKLQRESVKGQANSQLQLLQEQHIQLQDVMAELDDIASVEGLQQNLDKIRNQIARLGAINLAAIEEFDQQQQRKQYLDEQNDDLTQALESLEAAIRKIDRETRSRFKATYDKVNEDLSMLFPKVFGGGSAYLALTDDDLLETGVTIMARPPGKKNSTIHLLSGGEKALTALSLVFAIFRLNPAPFCMLDEVDAPLDDANVERFCRLLQEMSQTVQFIYISHNKITMEMAEQLIGVTMHEAGVSRVVAVDIDEAVALADAG